MLENPWHIGETARLHTTVTTQSGSGMAPVDPVSLRLKVKPPGQAAITYELTDIEHDGLGQYHVDILLDRAGTWYFRWECGGAISAATEGFLTIQPSRFQ